MHADETHANIKGKSAYLWVFTNIHEVAYLYSDSREGELAQTTLRGFNGVLVSDFYAVYDSRTPDIAVNKNVRFLPQEGSRIA